MPHRIGWPSARRWFVHLLHLDESAHRIALGAAIGIFIAFTPTVGLQMLLVFLVTSVIPANRVAGVPMVWLTNPATIPFVYWFNLWVGIRIVGGSDAMLQKFRLAITSLVDRDLTWWGLIKEWWDLAMTVALPLWIGSAVVGVAAGVVAYGIMYYLIRGYRRIHAHRLAARAAEAGGPPAAAPASGLRIPDSGLGPDAPGVNPKSEI